MDILKIALEWAKAEMFSTRFFILAGVLFLSASAGFWQLGKTDLARAYIIPVLVTGALLLTIGLGLFFTNKSRHKNFQIEYEKDAAAFVETEKARLESTLKEYTVVFKVVPILVIIAAFIVLLVDAPLWRAIGISTIAMLTVIMLIDGMAHARIKEYYDQLMLLADKM